MFDYTETKKLRPIMYFLRVMQIPFRKRSPFPSQKSSPPRSISFNVRLSILSAKFADTTYDSSSAAR